jgi:hypothetical protein
LFSFRLVYLKPLHLLLNLNEIELHSVRARKTVVRIRIPGVEVDKPGYAFGVPRSDGT